MTKKQRKALIRAFEFCEKNKISVWIDVYEYGRLDLDIGGKLDRDISRFLPMGFVGFVDMIKGTRAYNKTEGKVVSMSQKRKLRA